MGTDEVIAQLKRDVGVTNQLSELSEQEAVLAELVFERDRATANLRRKLALVEADFTAEIDALADGKIHTSADGSYVYRIFKGGRVVKVETGDIPYLAANGLFIHPSGYVYIKRYNDGKDVLLHRAIMNPPPGFLVDHAEADKLDNRRSKLRVVTPTENARNIRRAIGEIPLRGVVRAKNRYRATIRINGKTSGLGGYTTPEEAGYAYDRAAVQYFGEMAATNQALGLLPKLKSDDPLISQQTAPLKVH